jgi:hypothetical protein
MATENRTIQSISAQVSPAERVVETPDNERQENCAAWLTAFKVYLQARIGAHANLGRQS